eukprot:CAMPEP_0170403964 /NCGR_PEP_ID=MMETSP0117_2-20130122/26380_1 /TAXON_ID=400756 /ORGANISM="Durinskia baltica, Strain CSIRO CS-38" /LENGTH=64 /DNA_ID=CAMNT_0010660951 /DNA_START=39 /DNA_END=230 /DNA_ORIENTATION=+
MSRAASGARPFGAQGNSRPGAPILKPRLARDDGERPAGKTTAGARAGHDRVDPAPPVPAPHHAA